MAGQHPAGSGIAELLIPTEFGNIGVGGLMPDDGFTVGEVTYRAWDAENLAPGDGVSITLSRIARAYLD